jgi:hypothetical protein
LVSSVEDTLPPARAMKPATLIVMLSAPFALLGGIWLLWWLDYNARVAVGAVSGNHRAGASMAHWSRN